MSEEVTILVRIPIQAMVDDVKLRHNLKEELFATKLEGNNLVLYFRRPALLPRKQGGTEVAGSQSKPVLPTLSREAKSGGFVTEVRKISRRRRKTSSRNRMKTRGWQVVSKIVNANGQTAVVYKPFVDALFGQNLTPAQQRGRVADILRSNGNEPTEASIEYFLTNTIEYLAQVNPQETND